MANARREQFLFDQWEELIRSGRGAKVKKALNQVKASDLNREDIAQIANFSNRLNLPLISLKFLNSIVRPKISNSTTPTHIELAEYAIALSRIGVKTEATSVLEKLNLEKFTVSYLYSAFHCMTQWQYDNAALHLHNFLSKNELPYLEKTAQVNLIACYIFLERYSEALPLLNKIKNLAEADKNKLLLGNCLELYAQISIHNKEYAKAKHYLQEGRKLLAGSKTVGKLFVEKWDLLLQLQQSGPSDSLLSALEKFKIRCKKLSHWETLRDCDYFLAKSTQNTELAQYIYAGTPYALFQERLSREFQLDQQTHYSWNVYKALNKRDFDLDVFSGKSSGSDFQIKPGLLNYKLLQFLCTDFYKPFRIGSIFNHLFPGEYFNPYTSPDRVHKAIQRLRNMFRNNKIPLHIHENHETYALKASAPYALQITLKNPMPSKMEIYQVQILHTWDKHSFTAQQLAQHLGLSASKTREIIMQLVSEDKLIKEGNARSTRYRINKMKDDSN